MRTRIVTIITLLMLVGLSYLLTACSKEKNPVVVEHDYGGGGVGNGGTGGMGGHGH